MKSSYDFEENNNKYNIETFFTIEIILPKTCYFRGEIVKGKIKITPKDVVKKSLLLCPIIGNVILEENFSYKLSQNGSSTSEENILFKYPLDIPKFDGNKLIEGMEVPFEYPVPKNSYPSCIIDNYSYVRHILIFDFSTIEAKKSTLIIIKNEQYFTSINELYKAPVETTIKTGKHKFAIFYSGEMNAVLKLFKNVFTYKEPIPYTLDIDSSNLNLIKVQSVKISIILLIKKRNKSNHKLVTSKIEKILFEKSIPLMEDRNKYHLEDIIQLPKKTNPNNIYKKLDEDKNIYSEKYKNICLYPSCYDGLITCEYYLKLMLETDTLFSTNEFTTIPIDFYECDKNIEEEDNNINSNNNNLINDINTNDINTQTPMGNKYSKPMHSNTVKNSEIKKESFNQQKTFEQKNNKININSNNNEINNNIEKEKNDTPDVYEAPPSVFNSINNNGNK